MTHRQDTAADLILFNGRVTTLSTLHPEVSAVAVRAGKFLVVGSDGEVLALRRPATRVIDLGGRRVIPGLNDSQAILNAAALRACGYTRDTPDRPGGEIQRDRAGNPTGLLIARTNAMILYAALARGRKLPPRPAGELRPARHARDESAGPHQRHRCRGAGSSTTRTTTGSSRSCTGAAR